MRLSYACGDASGRSRLARGPSCCPSVEPARRARAKRKAQGLEKKPRGKGAMRERNFAERLSMHSAAAPNQVFTPRETPPLGVVLA